MDIYLWHSSSIKILNGVGLLNFVDKIDGIHYIAPITSQVVYNISHKLQGYTFDVNGVATIMSKEEINRMKKEHVANEDIVLYYLLKCNENLKVMVAGSAVMAKFDEKLHDRRVKLFDILSKIDFFKQLENAAKLDSVARVAKKYGVIVNFSNDDGFKVIHNIALGQQQG